MLFAAKRLTRQSEIPMRYCLPNSLGLPVGIKRLNNDEDLLSRSLYAQPVGWVERSPEKTVYVKGTWYSHIASWPDI